ncbi:MAG: hypothetical protein LBD37_02000 [Treponema sp.]|jgi:hypothetical protein|nr:hypothetical protein [Treponema sp.]
MKRNYSKSPAALGRLTSLAGIAALAAVISFGLAGCTTTSYLGIVTPHSADEVLADNVRIFEGGSYAAAAARAAEAGFEVILAYEGLNQHILSFLIPKTRVIAKDADGVRPAAPPADPAAGVDPAASAASAE